jgi:hypothetical protein
VKKRRSNTPASYIILYGLLNFPSGPLLTGSARRGPGRAATRGTAIAPMDKKDKLPNVRRLLQVQPLEWDPINFYRDFTLWPRPGTELTIDLDGTTLRLPVVGGAAKLKESTGGRMGGPIMQTSFSQFW